MKQRKGAYSNSVTRVVSTNIHALEWAYDFACTRKGIHLCFVRSLGKTIFAVLEL